MFTKQETIHCLPVFKPPTPYFCYSINDEPTF
jgi:hypothetical protein